MIEVVFGASEADSLKMSPLHTQADEILCMEPGLDVGEIRGLEDGDQRKRALEHMFRDGSMSGERVWKEYEEAWSHSAGTPEKLRQLAKMGKPVRIWYGRAPYEVCGYYFVCHLLSDLTDQISAVKLPEILYFHDTNMPYEVSMMGEIVSEEFPELLTYEKQLTEWDIQNGALHWGRLVQENAGLRASINGKIMSVPETFYDFMIENTLSEKPQKEAAVLGTVLGEYQVGIADGWLAHRIESKIREGEIVIMKDSPEPFERWICIGDKT